MFEGDPEVQIFDEGAFNFRLAVDTSQFGRTFQDRYRMNFNFNTVEPPQTVTSQQQTPPYNSQFSVSLKCSFTIYLTSP